MTTVTADRIPLADLEQIISQALAQGDYEHDTAWVRPESCPSCSVASRASGGEESCLIPMEEGRCEGHTAEVDTPPAHVVTLDILTAALPEPDTDGTVDTEQAARSVISVISDRLGGDYILRAQSLRRRLTEESGLYEQQAGLTDTGIPGPDDPAPGYSPKCQHCGGVIKAARGPKARYCSNSHKVMASRARKREREHVNATATADR